MRSGIVAGQKAQRKGPTHTFVTDGCDADG